MINSEYGLKKLERIYQKKVVPNTIKVLMKVYGVQVGIYKIKNKKTTKSVQKPQVSNKFSREIYQNNSMLANEVDEYDVIDANTNDYLNNLDKIDSQYVLLTTQTFQQYNGLIAGLTEEMNMYCLTYDFTINDIIEVLTKEGISKRYKVISIESIGDTTVVLKKYIVISIVV